MARALSKGGVKSLRSVYTLLRVAFFDRSGVFGMRSIAILCLVSVFAKSQGASAYVVNMSLFLGGLTTFSVNMLFSLFNERSAIVTASLASPLFGALAIYSVYSSNVALFVVAFIGILGFGGLFQSSAMSVLGRVTVTIAKYRPKLAHRVIVYFQWIGNAGIMLASFVCPKLKPLVAVSMCCFSLCCQCALALYGARDIPRYSESDSKLGVADVASGSARGGRKTIVYITILTILASPHLAIPAKIWTSWYVQGLSMNQNVLGFHIIPSQLTIVTPAMYALGVYFSNIISKTRMLSAVFKFSLAALSAVCASGFALVLQVCIERGVSVSIIWQIIPYSLAIMSDCIYLVMILQLVDQKTKGKMRTIAFSLSNLRFVFGALLNTLFWGYSKESLYSSMTMSFVAATLVVPFIAWVVYSLKVDDELRSPQYAGHKTRIIKKIRKIGVIARVLKRLPKRNSFEARITCDTYTFLMEKGKM